MKNNNQEAEKTHSCTSQPAQSGLPQETQASFPMTDLSGRDPYLGQNPDGKKTTTPTLHFHSKTIKIHMWIWMLFLKWFQTCYSCLHYKIAKSMHPPPVPTGKHTEVGQCYTLKAASRVARRLRVSVSHNPVQPNHQINVGAMSRTGKTYKWYQTAVLASTRFEGATSPSISTSSINIYGGVNRWTSVMAQSTLYIECHVEYPTAWSNPKSEQSPCLCIL